MGQVIAFSDFEAYLLKQSQKSDYCPGTILDTNVLVSLTYDVKADHEEITRFTASIEHHELPYFTTVTTRSEFLDFHRRLLMTENLLDAADGSSPWRLSERSRAEIKTKLGLLRSRESRKPGTDPVFTDGDLKDIKRAFSAGRFSGHHGWLMLCEAILKDRLERQEQELLSCGIHYISQHEESQKALFSSRIDWPHARRISETTCLGLSDAMILNALQCSRFSFAVSTDFDIGYSVLADPTMKDVVMPDSRAKAYRDYHFA